MKYATNCWLVVVWTGRLSKFSEDNMLPAWYFYPVPVPNVGTGMLLKVRAPSISYAALASQPARVFNRPTCNR